MMLSVFSFHPVNGNAGILLRSALAPGDSVKRGVLGQIDRYLLHDTEWGMTSDVTNPILLVRIVGVMTVHCSPRRVAIRLPPF